MSLRIALLLIVLLASLGSSFTAHAQSITADKFDEIRLLHTFVCEEPRYQFTVRGDSLVSLCDKKIKVWDLQTFELTHSLTPKSPAWDARLALSPDGHFLVESGYEENIHLWEVTTGDFLGDIPVIYEEEIPSWELARFSADSQHLVIWQSANVEGDNNFEVWALDPLHLETSFTSPNGTIWEPLLNSDGTQVFTVTDQLVIEQWDVASGELLDTLGSDMRGIVKCGDFMAVQRGNYGSDTTAIIGLEPNSLEERWSVEFDWLDFVTIEGCKGADLMLNHGSYETGDTLRFWDMASGAEAIPDSPIYSQPFSSYWMDFLRVSQDGSVIMPPQCGSCSGESVPFYFVDSKSGANLGYLNPTPELVYVGAAFSAHHLVIKAGLMFLIYGIPTEDQPAYELVPGFVMPSDINLRAAPSVEGEVIGFVEKGYMLISGRDESGDFLYLENVPAKESGNPDPIILSGWVSAKFVDLGDIVLEELPSKD